MGTRMTNAPIFYALVQARFNAVLAINQHVPKIQDALRKLGYPDYELAQIATVTPGPSAEQPPTFHLMARHEFMNSERSSGFVLEAGALSFHTTHYETIEPFLDAFVRALAVFDEEVGHLSYTERIGMRMLNAVCPGADERMADYLQPAFLGIFERLPGRSPVRTFSETRTRTDTTTLVSRATILEQSTEGSAAYPSEFGPVSLRQEERFTRIRGLYAVTDTDCWHEAREQFSLENIKTKVGVLHTEIWRSFKATVTPRALETWK